MIDLLAAVRVGCIDGQFIANPNRQQMQKSDLNLVVSVNQKGQLGNTLVPFSPDHLFVYSSDDRCICQSFIR